uniref:DUF4338 domain-containing protein n=1 Tax=Caenorhabditis tropicalis TaxID=1561998 RepID=A0A1I7TY31_9PELO
MLAGAKICHPGGIPFEISESAFKVPLPFTLSQEESIPVTQVDPFPPLFPVPPQITGEYVRMLITCFGSEKRIRALFTKSCTKICRPCPSGNFSIPKFVAQLFPELKGSQYPNWSCPEEDRQTWRKRIINGTYWQLVHAGAEYEPAATSMDLVAEQMCSSQWKPKKMCSPYVAHLPSSLQKKLKAQPSTIDCDYVDRLLKDFKSVKFAYDQEPGTSK